jgi:UDP:flavonoid glycosyltransferase YjiC (YdhE family)
MENVKKVFVMPIPYAGHVIPVASVIHELATKNPGLKVIFYGSKENEEVILKTGAEFRLYSHPFFPDETTVDRVKRKMSPFIELCYDIASPFCDQVIPQLLADFEKEKPDMIIYDTLALQAKYLLHLIKNRYEKKLSSLKPPKTIMFQTTFAQKPDIYPKNKELDKYIMEYDFWYYVYFLLLLLVQVKLNWKHGMTIFNMPKFLLDQTEKVVITTVYPEFQPKRELFDESFRFVGSCLSENARQIAIRDSKLREVLESYEPVNPIQSINSIRSDNRKLVYASLGTTFNNNFEVFEKIVNACRFSEDDFVGASNIQVVVSTGKMVYEKFQEKIKSENYVLPKNVLLQEFVPQLEVLKRASLFITHAGMNSASESIRYAVPTICLPLFVDQPLVAVRLVDDLKLGKRYDPFSFQSEELRQGIIEVLTDPTYMERMIDFTQACLKHNGVASSCEIILNSLNSSEKKEN